jgi:CRP-like cAMP-binding protein
MAEILPLNRADLNWLTQVGQSLQLTAGQVLLEADRPVQQLWLVLEGELELELPALGATPTEPIGQLGRGDLLGALVSGRHALPYRVQVPQSGPALVLAVDLAQVLAQAKQDQGFGARLFHSVALGLAQQHGQFVARLSQQNRMPALFVPKSIFSVFSCLQDQDICWMLGMGSLQRLEADTVCVAENRPPEALYITLQGSLTVWLNSPRPLVLSGASAPTVTERAVSQILPGELVGLSQFLDFGQNHYQIRANPDALVLRLPMPILQQKLQQDDDFAARFYRAAASLMAERTTQLFGALHYGDRCYECGDSLRPDQFYDDELALDELQQTSLARARFSWMLRQLNIKE